LFFYNRDKVLKRIHQIQPSIGKEERRELLDVIDSGWYTEAKKTREFEQKFAKFVGCKYASAVTSGTIALYVGLKSLGIGPGDEVIVPDFTFVASANSIEMTGAKPILIDIEPETLNLNLKNLPKLVTKKTKAIMPVNLNGRSTNLKKLSEFSNKHNIFLIEDAAHAIGSYYNGKHMGTIGDVAAFSFSIPKIITTGQGGMVITNNKAIYEKCLSVKDFGRKFGSKKKMDTSFAHDTIGYNFKFTEFQAAVGLAQMKKLKQRVNKKKKLYKIYKEMLSNISDIEFIDTNLKNITIWSADIILNSENKKTKLMNFLAKKNIETRIFFPAIHGLSPYKQSDRKFPISSDISKRGLWLPSSTTLTEDELFLVCNNINNFFKNS
jgi:perosamine synthetase